MKGALYCARFEKTVYYGMDKALEQVGLTASHPGPKGEGAGAKKPARHRSGSVGPYPLSPDEETAVAEGRGQARRGELVADERSRRLTGAWTIRSRCPPRGSDSRQRCKTCVPSSNRANLNHERTLETHHRTSAGAVRRRAGAALRDFCSACRREANKTRLISVRRSARDRSFPVWRDVRAAI